MRLHVFAMVATAAGLVAGHTHASEDAPARLRFEVEAACTDGADFSRRVHARSARLELAPSEDATAIGITIGASDTGGGFEGTMRIGESVRRVEGISCEDVADALSLVAALTFDPEAGTATATTPPPAVTSPPAPERTSPARSPLRPPPAPKENWRWALGLHAAVAGIDEVPAGASIVGEMARGRQLSTLTFRLALTTYSASVELGTRAARVLWSFLAPQVCPLRFRAGPLSVFPCGGVAMGVLSSGPTHGVERPKSFTRAWVASRGAVRARLALGARLGLEVEGALDVPVTRDRYSLAGVEVYRIPAIMPTLGLGVAMELP